MLCRNVTVRGVKVRSHGPNNDGCNSERCRDVLIEDCEFDTGDDCIATKSGKNADGRRVNTPSENIVIRRCRMKEGRGGVVIGSEVSGGVRNVELRGVTSRKSRYALLMRGFAHTPITGVRLVDCHFHNVEEPALLEHVRDLELERVTTNGRVVTETELLG